MRTISKSESVTEQPLASSKTPPVPFWRAILIGLLLIPFSTYFGNYAYVITQALIWGQTSLLRGPVFILFVLTIANLLFRKAARRSGLQPSEMLIIYSMIAISVCISGFGQMEWLINILPAGDYFKNASNHYDQFLFHVPTYLAPHNPVVINAFYRGETTMYRMDVLKDWATPVAVWSVFLFVMTWVTLCLTSLVRRQWTDEEKLNFPLIQLPLQMAEGGAGQTPFYKNKLMWAGFLIAGFLESMDYINYFFPGMPYVPIKPSDWHMERFLVAQPWSSIGTFTLAFYPFAIGLAFLLSCEVSFSCWFFYLLTRVENVSTAALGLNQGGGGAHAQAPFLGEQGMGAFIALGSFLLWRARKPIWDACRSAWDRKAATETDDPYSPLSPRVAFWGGVIGIAALTIFLCQIGLPIWIAVLFWAIYFLILIVLSRVYAEAGAGWAWGPLVPVHAVVMDMTGVSGMQPKALTAFGYLDWFDNEFRDTPMPHQLEAMKMGEETNTGRNQLLWALLLAAAISGIVAFWAYLSMYYEFGAASAKVRPALAGIGPGHLREIAHWINNPTPPDYRSLEGVAAGGLIVLALASLRQTFVWWPFHPIGYALAGTLSMEYMWCPFLIAWAAKSIVLRYGGVKLYRQAVPFALGLILGDYIVPAIWGLWGMAEHTQVYMSFPH